MLSEKLIQDIEKATGLTGLQGMIASEETQDVDLVKTFHFTEGEHRQLITNVQSDVPKEKWEEAKLAGHEMAVKALRDKLNIDFGGKTVESVYDYMHKQIELSKETDSTKIKDEYESDLNKLRSLLETKDKEISDVKLSVKHNTINSKIDSYFDTLQIQSPANLKEQNQIDEYVKLEREKNKNYFKSQYQFDIDEYNNIVSSKDGQILKDETLNPIKVDNLIKDYADKSFMSLKQSVKGRGEGDIFPSNNMTNFKDINEVVEHYEKKGVKVGTSQMDAVVAEFNKNNK